MPIDACLRTRFSLVSSSVSETIDGRNYILNRTGSIIVVALVSHISSDRAGCRCLLACLRPTPVDARYRTTGQASGIIPESVEIQVDVSGIRAPPPLCPIFRDPLCGEQPDLAIFGRRRTRLRSIHPGGAKAAVRAATPRRS